MPPILAPGPVGFIGLGNMGRPMARRLLGAGYRLVLLDKNPAALAAFEAESGARRAASPAALAAAAEAVITMLPDGKSVTQAVHQLAPGLKPGAVVIDMSSSDPIGTRELGTWLAGRGAALLDAPVSGGVRRAVDGTLATMVGGDKATIDRIRPVLEPMAKQIFETGPLGSGHAMKALNNLVSAAGLWIAAEALIVGRKFGLEAETMVDVLNASTGRNNSTEVKFKQQILNRAFGSGFSLGLMAKDLTTARDLAEATGGFAPLAGLCAELWREAADELGPEADHTAAVKYLERRAGKTLG
jgi:3-hydroxyisobutyrate dehydrogenase